MDFEIKKDDACAPNGLDYADFKAAIQGKKKFSFFIQDSFNTKKILKKITGARSLVVCTQSPINYTLDSHLGVVKKLAHCAKKNADIIWDWQVDTEFLQKPWLKDIKPKSKLFVIAAW